MINCGPRPLERAYTPVLTSKTQCVSLPVVKTVFVSPAVLYTAKPTLPPCPLVNPL